MSSSGKPDAWWENGWPFLVILWGFLVAMLILFITQYTLPN